MTDEELVKRLRWKAGAYAKEAAERIEALTAERDKHWESFVHWRKEADALTEQLKQLVSSNEYLNSRLENVLAREAETYAEHKELLEQLVAINEAARADAKEAEAYAEELAKDQVDLCRQLIAAEDKLTKAMELVTFASNMDVTDWSEALDVKDQARTTLAEIEGEQP
jgi:hypothetical protein